MAAFDATAEWGKKRQKILKKHVARRKRRGYIRDSNVDHELSTRKTRQKIEKSVSIFENLG
jgi:hypothetical protein